METIKNTVIGALEGVKDKIEQTDEAVKSRKPLFAGEPTEDAAPEGEDEISQDKLKVVGLELLDIGIHYGEKGVDKVKSLPLYQKVDEVVKFDDKFDLVKSHGQKLFTYLDGKIRPLVENVFFLYD